MSTPIYKLCLVKGMTEAYFQLSPEDKKVYGEASFQVVKGVGAEVIGPVYDCR